MASGVEAGQNYIRYDMTFTLQDLAQYTTTTQLRLDLTLNNADASALGPGIWLHRGSVTTDRGNLPDGVTVTLLRYPLPPIGYEQPFNLTLTGLRTLTPGVAYSVGLVSNPGRAEQDNAKLYMVWFQPDEECTVLCWGRHHVCRVGDNWTLAPIPGTFVLPDLPNEDDCYEGDRIYLPFIHR